MPGIGVSIIHFPGSQAALGFCLASLVGAFLPQLLYLTPFSLGLEARAASDSTYCTETARFKSLPPVGFDHIYYLLAEVKYLP